jgi:hypothetical protein
MKTLEITVGKTYSIKSGKSTITAKVIEHDMENQVWTCVMENGKQMTVKDSERFLEEIVSDSGPCPASESASAIKDIFARAAAAKIAAQHGFCTQEQADAIAAEARAAAEAMSSIAKEKIARANAAKIAAQHGFCSNEIAESLAKEAAEAKSALRLTGKGKGGGHVRGAMSGLDAAYKILLENGVAMNAKTITNIALEQGIWNPQGATPDMTLSAALQNDVKRKGDASRFIKASTPGHYIARAAQ